MAGAEYVCEIRVLKNSRPRPDPDGALFSRAELYRSSSSSILPKKYFKPHRKTGEILEDYLLLVAVALPYSINFVRGRTTLLSFPVRAGNLATK